METIPIDIQEFTKALNKEFKDHPDKNSIIGYATGLFHKINTKHSYKQITELKEEKRKLKEDLHRNIYDDDL